MGYGVKTQTFLRPIAYQNQPSCQIIRKLMNSTFKRIFTLRNQLLLSASLSQLNQKSSQCQPARHHFRYGSSMMPHPQKVAKGGEDAIYTHEKFLVVADGVGGWADYGVDPGLYSKELCKHIESIFLGDQSRYIKNPKEIIIKAHGMTKATGSTTICTITIDDDHLLVRASFVGDSGYAIYRKSEATYQLVFKSQEQQKGFNFPYQIGSEGDSPSCAISDQHEVQPNDLIVIGTDGLFDNLSAVQIKTILDEEAKLERDGDLQKLAKTIAGYAYRLSLDQNYASPFSRSARSHGYQFAGGKSDDISVIVAQVQQAFK